MARRLSGAARRASDRKGANVGLNTGNVVRGLRGSAGGRKAARIDRVGDRLVATPTSSDS